ncbi:Uncharacterised protein [Serratia marcescens]|nr:Uncharacterised protein [Serratia marcescens]CAI2116576.1 Uncharacterised protein [Serratia marcescens]
MSDIQKKILISQFKAKFLKNESQKNPSSLLLSQIYQKNQRAE